MQSYQQQVAERAERINRVIAEARPGESLATLAKRAGVSRQAIHAWKRQPVDEGPRTWPGLDKADEEIKLWLDTFSSWSSKKRKLAYGIFLHLTATGGIAV